MAQAAAGFGAATPRLAAGPASCPPIIPLAGVPISPNQHQAPWQRTEAGIASDLNKIATTQLPAVVRANYELELELTRTEGGESFALGLPIRDRMVGLALAGWSERADGPIAGLSLVDGKEVPDNATKKPLRLENGRTYKMQVRVEQAGNPLRITASLDGAEFIRWSGDLKDLSTPSWLEPSPNAITLRSHESRYEVKRCQLRMLDGQAWLRSPAAGTK